MESIPAVLVRSTASLWRNPTEHLVEQENYLVSQKESNGKREGETDVS